VTISGPYIHLNGQYYEKQPLRGARYHDHPRANTDNPEDAFGQTSTEDRRAVAAQQGLANDNPQQQAMQAAANQFAQMEAVAMAEDADTVTHESAHAALAGSFGGGIHYDMQSISMTMPDGSQRSVTYRAGGSVPISMPPINMDGPLNRGQVGKLQQTLSDLGRIQAAATAPAEPSGADMGVAAAASGQAAMVAGLIIKAQAIPVVPMENTYWPNNPGQSTADDQRGNRLNING